MDVAVPVDLGEFVTAGVADRDVVAAFGEAGHNGRPRWSRPSDDEGLHAVAVMVTRRRRSLGRDIGELIAQHPLEHLARGVARKRLDKFNAAWHFKFCQVCQAMPDHRIGIKILPRFEH